MSSARHHPLHWGAVWGLAVIRSVRGVVMTWFEGVHTQTLRVPAPPKRVLAHLHDMQSILDATDHIERVTVEGRELDVVLMPENHGVYVFKGVYRCRYEPSEHGLRWTTSPGGNVDQAGEITVRAEGAGSTLTYSETVRLDLPVGTLMARVARPVAKRIIIHEIKGFIARLTGAIPPE